MEDEHIFRNVFFDYNKSMPNLINYIQEYGNLTLDDYTFNNVDSLILCQLSYLRFENIDLDLESNIYPMQILENYIPTLVTQTRVPYLNEELLLNICDSLRYKNILLSNFSYNFDSTNEKQFCALTFHLPNFTDYIAFRGTDASFVGWKEDFNLCFQEHIPSQISALNYVNQYQTKHKLLLGGHSKGGNLAVYAGIHTTNKIHCIYNHDGPGFLNPYKTHIPIYKTIPQSSIIGLLMENTQNYQVIFSNALSILQHDPFTWQVENGDFIYMKQNDEISKYTQTTISTWLSQIDVQTRKQVIDTIYSLFSKYENPNDLKQNFDGKEFMKSLQNMDTETKKKILQTIQILLKTIKRG